MSSLHPGGFRGRMGEFVGRVFGYDNIKRLLRQRGQSYDRGRSIAKGNRWGGPHLHQREIARRQRQAARTSGASVNA